MRPPRRRDRFWRLVRANAYDLVALLRETRVALLGFAVLITLGTLYLLLHPVYQGQFSFPEAVYETLRLLSLQSGLDFPADRIGQLLFFLIPLLGLALIFQSVLNFGRLLLDKGSRREAWQVALASTYQHHIIVCGLSRVSYRVIRQLLASGYPVVAIDRDPQAYFIGAMRRLQVPVVIGDAREPHVLVQAGAPRARSLVVGIDNDLLNIEMALNARAVNSALHVVLRVFNEALDRNLERNLDGCSAFSASGLAAPTFTAATVSRDVDVVLPLGDTLLGVTRVRIQPDSLLTGFVRGVEEQRRVRVLRHTDGRGRPLPRTALRQLDAGDEVTLLGPLDALEHVRLANVARSKLAFLQPQVQQHPDERYNTVIICGFGKVSYRVIRRLHALHPRPRIVLIRRTPADNGFDRHISDLNGVETVVGDARNPDILRQAGIERAYAVAGLIADDLVNLQIGLAAREIRPDVHVVLRVFSDALAVRLGDLFGIRTAYSTSALAAPAMAAAAILPGTTQAFYSQRKLYAIQQSVVQQSGRTIEQEQHDHGHVVVALSRHEQRTIFPDLTTPLQPGDRLDVLVALGAGS